MSLSLLGNLRKGLLALTIVCFVVGVAVRQGCFGELQVRSDGTPR